VSFKLVERFRPVEQRYLQHHKLLCWPSIGPTNSCSVPRKANPSKARQVMSTLDTIEEQRKSTDLSLVRSHGLPLFRDHSHQSCVGNVRRSLLQLLPYTVLVGQVGRRRSFGLIGVLDLLDFLGLAVQLGIGFTFLLMGVGNVFGRVGDVVLNDGSAALHGLRQALERLDHL